MKTMQSVYKKIKKNYKNIEIDFNDKEEYIIIKRKNIKIEADLDRVDLFKDNKEITHFHPKNYNEIYSCISLFLDDVESMKRYLRKGQIRQYIIVIVGCIFLLILESLSSKIGDIVLCLGYLIVLICLFLIIYLLFEFFKKKYLLSKISKEDLKIIKKYYSTNKDWGLLSQYDLYFSFECIDKVIYDFFKMKKKLNLKKEDLFDKDMKRLVTESKNKDILEWYKLAKNAIDCIYKYYDFTGRRAI